MDTKTLFAVLSVGLLGLMCVEGQESNVNDTNSPDTTTSSVVMTTELGYAKANTTALPITTSGHTVTSQTTAMESTSSVTQTTSDLVTISSVASSMTSSVTSSMTSDTVGTTSAGNITSTKAPPPCPTGKFDAASFFGGILLGLGLCIVSSLIYKWYQSNHRSGDPYQQF